MGILGIFQKLQILHVEMSFETNETKGKSAKFKSTHLTLTGFSFMKSHQSQQAVRIGAVPSKLSTFGCCVGTVEGSCLLADESHNHHHQTQSKQIIQPANTLRSPNIMFRDHLGVGAGGYR